MKLKATIPILAGLLLLASCSNEEPLAPQQTDEPEATLSFDRELSADDAVAIAREAVICLKYGDAVESRSATSLTPSQVRRYPAVSRSATTPGTYIVNFAEGGYAVVVADTYDPQVLALNDEGIFDPDTQPGNAYFMTLADDYLAATASLLDSISFNPLPPPIGEGGETPVNPNPGLAYVWHDGHRCGRTTSTVTAVERFNLLTTTWHQESPYNKYCEYVDETTGLTMIAVAGCVPIAMAQIMAYHGKPTEYNGHNFNWESITSSKNIVSESQDADDVAFLIGEIGRISNIKYNINGSSVYRQYIVPTFKAFGYVNVKEMSYSSDVILSEVKSSRPVAIAAMDTVSAMDDISHRWVIDGAFQTKKVTTRINLDTNQTCYVTEEHDTPYFHCNWGWGSLCDGFYLSEVFEPLSYSYNESYHVVYNIY